MESLEGARGVGLLGEKVVVMARGALDGALGSTSRASAGCSHGHLWRCRLLAFFADGDRLDGQ